MGTLPRFDAKVRCGLAVYHLDDDNQILCFGEATDEGIIATPEGFHCWVEVEGWLLDFMAPTFRNIKQTSFTVQPRMFQKQHSKMVDHPNDMTHAGDFFFRHDQELADSLLAPICENLGVQDLARLCSQWFKKTPKRIPLSATSTDQNGKMRPISLPNVSLKSNW